MNINPGSMAKISYISRLKQVISNWAPSEIRSVESERERERDIREEPESAD